MSMRNISLIVNLSNGKVAEPTNQYPFTLKAQSGATYTMLNKNTNTFPDGLILKRNGNALEVEIEQEVVARIEDFYGDNIKATFSLDGSITPPEGLTIISSAAITITDETESQVVWQPSETHDEGSTTWFWAAGALGAGSVATAFALYSDNGSSDGNSSSNTPATDDPDNSNDPSSGYDIIVNAAAGPFQSAAVVEIYDTNGNLLTTGNFDATTGQVSLRISNGYQGPVLVKVIDNNGVEGDYLNETSNTIVNLDQPLRAMGTADGSGDFVISVTPLTELAVRHAGITDNTISETDLAANDQVANLFGVENILAPVVTVLTSGYDGSDGFSEPEHYGAVLAQLSGSDINTGSLSITLDQLESEIIDLDSGELALTPEGVELLLSGNDAFSAGPNGYLADIMEPLVQHPIIEAALGGINETEKNAGVIIKVPDVYIGNKVTLFWGDQSYSFIINESNLIDGKTASFLLPGSTIEAAGDGNIIVCYQINDDEQSPPVLVTVNTSVSDADINNISLSDDTGNLSNDFITSGASQTITATLSSELSEGETLHGSINGGSTWVDITDTITSGTSISWAGVLLSGSSSIQFMITDTFGNQGDIISQPYFVDTIVPSITINPVASDGIINTVEDDSDIIITGTTSGVENGQNITVTLNSINYTGEILNNEWNITLPAADAQALAEGQHTITADVSDIAGNTAPQATGFVTHASTIPAISIETISGDGFINNIEADNDITINGTTNNIEDNQQVTITLNGQNYTGNVTSGTWNVIIPATDVQGLTEGLNSVTADASDIFGNAATQATSTITYDTIAPSVNINTIANDDIINGIEDNTDITIDGTCSGVENGQIVSVNLNGVSYAETVNNDSWSITIPALDVQSLAESSHTITADVSDLAGNAAEQAAHTIFHDSIPPTININTVATDGIINNIEDNSDVMITGGTSGVENGQTITVNLNGQSYSETVNNNIWSVSIPAADAQALPEGISNITADVSDTAGNAAPQATGSVIHNTVIPAITINVVSTDGIINANEDNSNVIITGSTSGVENGRTITVNLNGQSYSETVNDNAWSVSIPAADAQALPEGINNITADVSNTAGNAAPQATGTVNHDTAIPTITINAVSTDGIINASEDDSNVIITGTTSGVENSRTVIVNLNGQNYTDTVNDNTWSVSIPAADVQALPEGISNITADVSSSSGNSAPQANGTVIHDTVIPTLTINVVSTDGIINANEDDSNVIITGTTSGVENGQTITVNLNGQSYSDTLNNNAWSVSIPADDAQALPEGMSSITADVSDTAGNAAPQATGNVIHDSTPPTVSYNDAVYNDAVLTLTGVNIATLLSDGESAATDLQDNFDWSRLEWNIEGDSVSTITFSGADITSVYASDTTTLAVTFNSIKADELEATASFDPLVADDTITITEGFSGDTAGNMSTTDAYVSAEHVDESIVVFDTVNNTSSSHSSRQFDENTSYSIYILVDADGLPTGQLPEEQFWSDAKFLGSDDEIILVSHDPGNPILGRNHGEITTRVEMPGAQIWYTGFPDNAAFTLHANGDATRYYSVPTMTGIQYTYEYALWHGKIDNMQWMDMGNQTLVSLPDGIMTSQGLA